MEMPGKSAFRRISTRNADYNWNTNARQISTRSDYAPRCMGGMVNTTALERSRSLNRTSRNQRG